MSVTKFVEGLSERLRRSRYATCLHPIRLRYPPGQILEPGQQKALRLQCARRTAGGQGSEGNPILIELALERLGNFGLWMTQRVQVRNSQRLPLPLQYLSIQVRSLERDATAIFRSNRHHC